MIKFIAHASISLSLALIVLAVLNIYNPLLGLFQADISMILIGASGLCSIVSSAAFVIHMNRDARKNVSHRKNEEP